MLSQFELAQEIAMAKLVNLSRPIVAVDVDGVLCTFKCGWQGIQHFGDVFDGAVEFTHRLGEFADVLIYSCRTSEDVSCMSKDFIEDILKRFLDEHDFYYTSIWVGHGKPFAHAYIDDRSVPCIPDEGNPKAEYELALEWSKQLFGEKAI